MPELFDRPTGARRRMLWMHDTDYGPRLTPERAAQIDDVLVLSGWHQMHVISAYPFLDGKLRIIRNGIDLDRFWPTKKEDVERPRKRRLLYTSSPDRGLDILLELWPRIRKRVPGALFEFAYAPVYQAIAGQDPTVGKHHARIQELAGQKGVTGHLDGLSQPELARLMLESLVWAAPSYNTPHDTPFYETSCIGAMEAQAAGCHVVASGWGALCETVKAGRLIPAGDGWRQELEDAIVEGLTNAELQAHAQTLGPAAMVDMGWDGVAAEISELVELVPTLA
jgi:glycosyltransferase involved in cell wall biosynthesis